MREQNALPYETGTKQISTAKDDVDNVGAGRAAKGANPLLCAKKTTGFDLSFFLSIAKAMAYHLTHGVHIITVGAYHQS